MNFTNYFNNIDKWKKCFFIAFFILLGIILRFLVSKLGNNFDFASFTSIGEIAYNGKNIYHETPFYNYSPLYSSILGWFFGIAKLFSHHIEAFRFILISLYTLVDLAISCYIAKETKVLFGILFFLNPVSIIISGYHNQFDNIAVLLALIAAIYIGKASEENSKKLTKYDAGAIVFLSLSLLFKHLLFIFPIWILFNTNIKGIKRKLAYIFIPVLIFLMSFIPFLFGGFIGIMRNVFLYRSFNNMPIFAGIHNLFPQTTHYFMPIFILLIIAAAFIFRNEKPKDSVALYFICLVCFSSAIANQYLIIPIASLFLLNCRQKFFYIAWAALFLILDKNGLNFITRLFMMNMYDPTIFNVFVDIVHSGYSISAYILLFAIADRMRFNRLKNKD